MDRELRLDVDRLEGGLGRIRYLSLILVVLVILLPWLSPGPSLSQKLYEPNGPVSASDIPIATLYKDQSTPRIAYSTQSSEYLVVFVTTASATDHDLYAREVAADGTALGSEQALVWDTNDEINPAIAYNSTDNQYLVVWEQVYSATDHDIWACRVNVTPGACTSFQVAYTPDYDSYPTVTYNPDAKEYLVVFERRRGSNEFIYHDLVAQRVSAAGAAIGDPIVMTSNGLDQRAPSVAYGGGNYLLTWQGKQAGSAEYNIYAQVLGGQATTPGGILPVCTWEGDQLHPRLAYDADHAQFLVAWEDHHWASPTGWSIYALRLDTSGNPLNTQIAISTGGEKNRLNPDVAYNTYTRGFQVAWELQYNLVGDYDIYSRRVAYDGSLPEVEKAVIATGYAERAPTIASGAAITLLIAWEDSRNLSTTGMDIYGSLMTVSLPNFSGTVYQGEKGVTNNLLIGVTVSLYCSSGAGVQGSLIANSVTDDFGVYALPAYVRCEYYNIIETDPDNFYSTGDASPAGQYVDNNWIYYTDPLTGKDLTANNFWDLPKGPIDTTSPGNWSNFYPSGWVNNMDRNVNFGVKVQDGYSGLDVGSAKFSISEDAGATWNDWHPANCTGSNTTTNAEAISAADTFSRDSGPNGPNLVRFQIQDMAVNIGQSPSYNVKIDTVSPLKPTDLDCPTHPSSEWRNTNLVSCSWSGASDALSGVYGYTMAWDHSVLTLPGLNGASSGSSVSNVPLGDGEWYFHVRTIDNAGNGSDDAEFFGPIRIDTTPPDAWITSPSPGSVDSKQVTVTWTGVDSPSGIYSFDLQKSTNGGAWEDWYMDTSNTQMILFGDHAQSVSLRVRARDVAGNLGAWSPVVTIDFGVKVTALVQDEAGSPVANADVYLNGAFYGQTYPNGMINLYGVLIDDEISARSLVATFPTSKDVHNWIYGPNNWAYRVYITSLSFDNNGAPQRFLVKRPNDTQTLVVSKTNTLIGFNIVVSVEWDANAAYLTDLEQGFQKASAYLFDVTDGQMYFEAVDIWDNKSYWGQADYHILAQDGYRANARVNGIHQGTDAHLILGRGISWTQGTGFRTFIHEWGHYGFDLYDEYMDRNGKENVTQCTIDRTASSPDADAASFMDDQRLTTEMCSSLPVHPHNTNTMQDAERGGPCWDTVFARYSDAINPPRWTIVRPNDRGSIMPGPNSLPEKDWSKWRTNGMTSNACNPFDTLWVNPDGSAALDYDAWVKGGSRDIYEGKTNPDNYQNPTVGIKNVLGAYPGDTVYVHKDCGWFCSYSGSITASCSTLAAQPVGPGILQKDPFSMEASAQVMGDGVSLQINVVASTPLPAPPQAQVLQDGAAPINQALSLNGSTYSSTFTLNPSLPRSGRIYIQAIDGQGHTVNSTTAFESTQIQSGDITWVKSEDGRAEAFLLPGSLDGTPYVTLEPGNPISVTQGSLALVGKAYTLKASNGTSLLNAPGTLNIYFEDVDIARRKASAVALYRWDDFTGRWIQVEAAVDWTLPSASATITQLGTYAILADTTPVVYFPVVRRK